MPSRYMHLFNAVRAIPLGRKSVTRNGWANFLFRSASGLYCIPILYIYIYFYTIYVYYISIYTYIHISKYRRDVYSLKSARWRIEGWETKHEPGWCWLYRKAVDLDEVKYKLSSLVCPHQRYPSPLPNFFPTNF